MSLFSNDQDKEYICVIYTRISEQEKSEYSKSDTIESQRDICESHIKTRPNWKLLRKRYDDRNQSGGKLDRPAFKELLRDAERGKFNMIVVKSIDRFSRDLQQFFQVYPKLKALNVHLSCASQSFSTNDATGQLILQILLSFAEFERKLASERTRDRMRFRAKKGLFHGGNLYLGYDDTKEKGVLRINQKEAKLVKMIFDKYIDIQSAHKVATYINGLGYRTKLWTTKAKKRRGGNRFTELIVLHIIKNVAYIGKTKANKEPISAETKPDKELFPARWKPIIDQRTFDRAQRIIAKNYKTRTSISENKYKLLLTGLIWCGSCKSQMTANYSLKNKGGRKVAYLYYKCTKVDHSDKTACTVKSVPARELEYLIIDRIKMLSQDKKLIEIVVKKANELSKSRLPELIKTRNEVLGELTKIRNNAQPLIDALQTTKFSLVQDKLNRLEEQKTAIENRLRQLEQDIENERLNAVDPNLVIQNLNNFRTVFDRLEFEKQRLLLTYLIGKIIYNKDHSKIRIKFRNLPEIQMPPERPNKGNSGGISSRFDERMYWLPREDSNLGQRG